MKTLTRLTRLARSSSFDLAAGPILVMLGAAALGIVIAIPLVEAVVLRLVGWGRMGRCVRDAFAVNLVSTCVGVWLATAFLDASDVATRALAFATMFAGTVLVEGVSFKLLDREQRKPVLLAAVLPNVVSYALLAPLWFLL